MIISQNQIELNKSRCKTGCACIYIPISNKLGIKLYETRKHRDFAWMLQKLAYRNKVGPKTFGKLDLKRPVKINSGWPRMARFGYITQIAYTNNRLSYGIISLKKKLKKIGLSIRDIEVGHNVGRIGRRLVCIDFDRNSHFKLT